MSCAHFLRTQVIERESVIYTPEGLEAVVFTADGDMRQVRLRFDVLSCSSAFPPSPLPSLLTTCPL